MCRILEIKDYSIRKISIGIKLFCTIKDDFEKVRKSLSSNFNFEYFTYAAKNEKPYKAILLGLDKTDPTVIKSRLIKLGLKCIDVKIVTKTRDNNSEQVIFIVYFERKTITLKELRQNYCSIDYIKVRWEYQKPNKSKLTQCYNCQMFGHGSSRCMVKTFCAQCAENHKTSECKSLTVKCANCNGPHKAMSPECPSRQSYSQLRQRSQPRNVRQRNHNYNNNNNYSQNFPNSLNQNQLPNSSPNIGYNQILNQNNTNQNASDLFSFEEIKNMTFELISNLRKCKSRQEQFEVVTNLAYKFLYP